MAAPLLEITLLGAFDLKHEGVSVPALRTERLQSLLAYLALRAGVPQPRRHVAFSFWPDARERQAFNNLRNLLYRLRQALPEPDRFLEVDAQTICWRADAPCAVDAVDFERCLTEARDAVQRADAPAAVAALEAAVEGYGGDLLTGLYDEWILPERDRLREACAGAYEQLARLLEAERAYARALRHARRFLQLDPLREPTYRLLMRLHALVGDRAGVRRAYETCVEVLRRELDLAPEAKTEALYERLTGAADDEAEVEETSAHAFPLVGRRAAWERLRDAWRAAERSRAHLVSVTGEAGIGKTRLAGELLVWAGRQGAATAEARSYAAEGRLAYAPVAEWLRADALEGFRKVLDDVWLGELARVLPELHTERSGLPAPEPLREPWQRRRFFEALARAVLAAGRPLLLVLDDAQWADRDTLEWLRFLLHFGAEAPLLVLVTVRREEVGPDHPLRALLFDLGRTAQSTDLALGPLSADETARLARAVAGRALGEAQSAWLYRETEGNPLFVVERVRAGLPEEGTAEAGTVPLPPTVQAVIAKRLAGLGPEAQALAGLAAVVGRAFDVEVLLRTGVMEETTLVDALDEVWRAGVVRPYGAAAYDFTHDRLREAAYDALGPARRQLLHRRVAEALAAVHAGDPEAVAARVAAHHARGGRPAEAVDGYARAAEAAERIGAHEEVVRWATRALDLLATLPEGRGRDERELALRMRLGLALRVAAGHAAPEVGDVYERAQALTERVGDAAQRFAVRRGLWSFHLLRGEYARAEALAEGLEALAAWEDDDAFRLEAGVALGLTRLWQGALGPAREVLVRSLGRYDPARHAGHVARYGQDPGVACRSLLAYVECLLGHTAQSEEHLAAAFALAEEVGHPFSLAYARQHAMLVAHARRDPAETLAQAEALEASAEEHGFTYWLGPARIGRGWALARQGQAGHGLALLDEGLAAHRARGARLSATVWLAMRAEACALAGRTDEALAAIEEAQAEAEATGEHVWDEALRRLRRGLAEEKR